MNNSDDNEFLLQTLIRAGLTSAELSKMRVLAEAGKSRTENERVHASTNQTIFDLLRRNELGRCIHVTGGARALTDPYHRAICEAIQGRDKEPFQVLYHVPENRYAGNWGVVSWNLERWERKGFSDWREKLLTLNMIGTEAVDLKAYDERESLQFSVFGSRYAQIQSHHPDDADAKYVWLVESENVNGRLAEMADKDLRDAVDIDERAFARFVSALYSNSARRILLLLAEEKNRRRDDVLTDNILSFLDPQPDTTFEALSIMKFFASDETGNLRLTKQGHSFLESS